jgi:hypothetical protein
VRFARIDRTDLGLYVTSGNLCASWTRGTCGQGHPARYPRQRNLRITLLRGKRGKQLGISVGVREMTTDFHGNPMPQLYVCGKCFK